MMTIMTLESGSEFNHNTRLRFRVLKYKVLMIITLEMGSLYNHNTRLKFRVPIYDYNTRFGFNV